MENAVMARVMIGGILILGILVLGLLGVTFSSKIKTITGDAIYSSGRPVLSVLGVSSEAINEKGECYSVLRGEVSNAGEADALIVNLICRRAAYPLSNEEAKNVVASQSFDKIGRGERKMFEIKVDGECDFGLRFDCSSRCDNC